MKNIKTATVYCFCFCLFLFGVASASEKKPEEATIKLSKNIILKMKSKPFIPNQHKITTCKVLDWTGTCLIDGKPLFGTDWETPRSQLVEATVELDGLTKVKLDVSNMFDPWTGEPKKKDFKVTEVEGGFLIHGEFSDGAGSYIAEWLVVDGSSVRTKLKRDER
jgi:hypothetical protein